MVFTYAISKFKAEENTTLLGKLVRFHNNSYLS